MSKIDVLAATSTRAAHNLNELIHDGYIPADQAEAATDYVIAVINALRGGSPALLLWLTSRCTECGDIPDRNHDEVHVAFAGHVIIGCEGYWIINPAAVGLPADNWDDWRQTR